MTTTDHILPILYDADFDQEEAAVYVAMLHLGPSTVTSIAAESRVERMMTFRILRRLLARKVVNTVLIGKRKHYFPKHPSSLVAYYEEKKRLIEAKKAQLQNNIQELSAIYLQGGFRPFVSYFEGSDGFRSIFKTITEEMSECKEKTFYIYSPQFISLHHHIDFYMPTYFSQKKKLGLFSKTISCYPKDEGNLEYLKDKAVKKDDNTINERRYIPRDYFFVTYQYILAKSVISFSLDDDYCLGTIITHNRFCESQKKIFEFIWHHATTEKDLIKLLGIGLDKK